MRLPPSVRAGMRAAVVTIALAGCGGPRTAPPPATAPVLPVAPSVVADTAMFSDTTPAPVAATVDRRAGIARAIDSILAAPDLAPTHVGIAVWSLDRREWVVERDAAKLFVPASNAKLLAAAAALSALGPSRRFATRVIADGPLADSTIAGDITLVAGGAPDLSTGDLVALAERLRAIGVREVRGGLVADASLFDSTALGPGWMWDEGSAPYAAPVSAFLLEDNVVALTVRPGRRAGAPVRVATTPQGAGVSIRVEATTHPAASGAPAITVDRPRGTFVVRGTMPLGAEPVTVWRAVSDPPLYAANVFAHALRRTGITVRGPIRVVRDSTEILAGSVTPRIRTTLAEVRSAPLEVLVRRFLKESHNLTGEVLVKQLGVAAGTGGSWRDGLAAMRIALRDLAGVAEDDYRVADGSGLSRYTQVTPRVMATIIRAMCERPAVAPEFLAALPIGGTDGTLSRRSSAEESGVVRAKTGTMSGVSALSGVVTTRAGERLAFSILMNGHTGPSWVLRSAQDGIVGALRGLKPG